MPAPPLNSAGPIFGRGANNNPPNRFEPILLAPDPDCPAEEQPHPQTQFMEDSSESLLTQNEGLSLVSFASFARAVRFSTLLPDSLLRC
ncbi:MAG: hypothetical protein ABIZ81_04090 [Opitutaceae bacterium]